MTATTRLVLFRTSIQASGAAWGAGLFAFLAGYEQAGVWLIATALLTGIGTGAIERSIQKEAAR